MFVISVALRVIYTVCKYVACNCGGLCLIPGQSVWKLWGTNCLSFYPSLSFHQWSRLIFHLSTTNTVWS